MGNPLISELVIGRGYKGKFSKDETEERFAIPVVFLYPTLARMINALANGAVAIKAPPRADLLPVGHLCAAYCRDGNSCGCGSGSASVEHLRPLLNKANRMGLLGVDPAGSPNGRRVSMMLPMRRCDCGRRCAGRAVPGI